MATIDFESITALFELFWWFSIGVFFLTFIVKMVLNFFNR